MKGQSYAVISGVLAATAGLCGKYAMTQSESEILCETIDHGLLDCNSYIIYIRVFFGILMLLVNSLMWTTFVKALSFCANSLEATVTNTAANFFSTATYGYLLFGEALPMMWWLGIVFIIVGLCIIRGGEVRAGKKKKVK